MAKLQKDVPQTLYKKGVLAGFTLLLFTLCIEVLLLQKSLLQLSQDLLSSFRGRPTGILTFALFFYFLYAKFKPKGIRTKGPNKLVVFLYLLLLSALVNTISFLGDLLVGVQESVWIVLSVAALFLFFVFLFKWDRTKE